MSEERFTSENTVLVIAAVVLIILLLRSVLTHESDAGPSVFKRVSETNLGGLRVMDSEYPQAITYADGSIEYFQKNFVGLFINGSIIKNASIIIENGRALGPLRLISEKLGAKVSWDPALYKVTINDGDRKIELEIGDKNPRLNGQVIPIDVAPIIINDYTYVPIRFIAESLNCSVEWFDGNAAENNDSPIVPQAHYVLRMPHVMISRYPAKTKTMTPSEAIEKVKAQLVIAYEKKYHTKFKPLAEKPETWIEQDSIRFIMSNLFVASENDRFFIIPAVWDFMIDKYTGTIFVFYDGEMQAIDKYKPNAPGPLDFVVNS